jgi:hypothetical protein
MVRADQAQAGVASGPKASFDVIHQSISSKGIDALKSAAPTGPSRETLAGSVERVTFHNEGSGFAVLKAHVRLTIRQWAAGFPPFGRKAFT